MYRSRFELRSVIIGIIVANAVIYLITQFSGVSASKLGMGFIQRVSKPGTIPFSFIVERYGLVNSLFSLFPAMIVQRGWVWQFVTYLFLHANFWHLFFNMYALFLFGRPLEEKWGWKQFLAFYLVTGAGAGVVTFVWHLAANPYLPTIGASGAVFGVMLAFALEYPNAVLLLFFLIPVRAMYAVLIYGGIELVMLLTGTMSRIGHFTHLAGLFFGFLYYMIAKKVGSRRTLVRFPGGGMFSRGARSAGSRGTAGWATRRERKLGSSRRGTRREGSDQKRARDVELTLAIKEKLRRGDPLTRLETAFLLKLKNAFQESRGGICEPDEFDFSASSCIGCEDFHACLYRFVIGQM